MTVSLCCSIIFIASVVNGYHLSPRTVMFGGYYSHPRYPQASMSWASGDTFGTNSFAAPRPTLTLETATKASRTSEEAPEFGLTTRRTPKRKPTVDEGDEADEESSWPFSHNQNVFFPIMFGSRRSEGNEDGGYYPGSATAIANSFSTGKGGVATSHATSFGDPYLTTLFRNGYFNKKNPKPGSNQE